MFIVLSLFCFSYSVLHFIPRLTYHHFSPQLYFAPPFCHIYYIISIITNTHRFFILNLYSRYVLLVSSVRPSSSSYPGTGRRHYHSSGMEVRKKGECLCLRVCLFVLVREKESLNFRFHLINNSIVLPLLTPQMTPYVT
jgi:hypothetical protein